jgi:hypothetical protein
MTTTCRSPFRLPLLTLTPVLASAAVATHAQIPLPKPNPLVVVGYYLTDLGVYYGASHWSFAYGINNAGQVVGEVAGGQAFRTAANQPYLPGVDMLGVLGLGTSADKYSRAYALDTNGPAVGNSLTEDGRAVRAFVPSRSARWKKSRRSTR